MIESACMMLDHLQEITLAVKIRSAVANVIREARFVLMICLK